MTRDVDRLAWHPSAGFALPGVILLVALLTALLLAGLSRVAADVQIAAAGEDIAAAVVVAQNGLQTYLGQLTLDACERPIRPPDGDSVRINVAGGYAEVVARVVMRPADTLDAWLYVVRSMGYVIEPAAGAVPTARRTVAQFAQWQSADLGLPAVYTAANGLNRLSGGGGELRGVDQHASSSCRLPDLRALRVSGTVPDLSGFNLSGGSPQGGGTGAGIVNTAGIDWLTASSPGGIVPDFTTPQYNNTDYPVQVVLGDATLGVAGQSRTGYGLLVVAGELTVVGTLVQWYGVVLVGGRLRFNADDQRFDGLVAAGLNVQFGPGPGTGTIGGDYTDIDYDSREVLRALRPLAGFSAVTNGYFDNWPVP